MNKIDDTEYWEQYYARRRDPSEPSRFADHVVSSYLADGGTLIELGCGNGRDALYFARSGATVLAIDQCTEEIDYLQATYGGPRLRFIAGDFTLVDSSTPVSYVYSRFTIHAIPRAGWDELLLRVSKVIREGGYLFLEFRGKRNELFGRGEPVLGEPDAFIFDGHFRRFIDMRELTAELQRVGFQIIEQAEEPGFSPTSDTNETFARVVARLSSA